MKCLQKAPRDRYESAEAFAADLRRWRAGEAVTASPARQPRSHKHRWLRRLGKAVGLAAVGLGLLLGVAFGIRTWMSNEPRAGPAPVARQSPGASGSEAKAARLPLSQPLPAISWSRGPDLPESYDEMRAIVLEGKLYVVGGRTLHREPYGCVSTVQVYDPQSGAWSSAPPVPEPLAAAGLAVHGGYLYCMGGTREPYWWGAPVASAYGYDPRSTTWKRLPDMPIARSSFAIGVLGNRIYCAGGNIRRPYATDRVDAYDLLADKWLDAGVMPQRRGSCAGGPWRNLLVIGPGLPSAPAAMDQRIFAAGPGAQRGLHTSTVQWEVDSEANFLFSDEAGVYCLARTNRRSAQIFICHLNVETGKIVACQPPAPVSRVLPAAAYDSEHGMAYLIGGETSDPPGRALEKAMVTRPGSASF